MTDTTIPYDYCNWDFRYGYWTGPGYSAGGTVRPLFP